MRHGFRHSCRNSSDLRGEIPESCDPGRHSTGPMALKASVCNTQVAASRTQVQITVASHEGLAQTQAGAVQEEAIYSCGMCRHRGTASSSFDKSGVWIFSCHATNITESLRKPPMICATEPWPLDLAQGRYPACECC